MGLVFTPSTAEEIGGLLTSAPLLMFTQLRLQTEVIHFVFTVNPYLKLSNTQVISEVGKGLALVVKSKSISGLKLLNISSTILDFYLKFVPDIHFPVQDTDTKFQTVSQRNQDVTTD
jgi:hypothetical protein